MPYNTSLGSILPCDLRAKAKDAILNLSIPLMAVVERWVYGGECVSRVCVSNAYG